MSIQRPLFSSLTRSFTTVFDFSGLPQLEVGDQGQVRPGRLQRGRRGWLRAKHPEQHRGHRAPHGGHQEGRLRGQGDQRHEIYSGQGLVLRGVCTVGRDVGRRKLRSFGAGKTSTVSWYPRSHSLNLIQAIVHDMLVPGDVETTNGKCSMLPSDLSFVKLRLGPPYWSSRMAGYLTHHAVLSCDLSVLSFILR